MSSANDVLSAIGKDPADYELFTANQANAPYGSTRYFKAAIEAGYYGVDNTQTVAFKKREA